jgi:hypothetical protein
MNGTDKIKIALISCVSQKTNFPNKVKDLYISPLFKKTWEYNTKIDRPDGVFILSALHGLIKYDKVIDPYDKTLLDMSKEEALEWAEKVKSQIKETFETNGRILEDYHFMIYAGSKYYENLLDFFPSKELVFGKLPIGKRLGALTSALRSGKKIVWEDFK